MSVFVDKVKKKKCTFISWMSISSSSSGLNTLSRMVRAIPRQSQHT